MSWRGRSTYRRRPRRYVEPPEMIGPMLPEQFSDEEVEPPKPEEGEPATQSQDPAPAQEGEDEGASAGQGSLVLAQEETQLRGAGAAPKTESLNVGHRCLRLIFLYGPEPEAESQEEVRPTPDYEREDGPDVRR
nr:G antigen 10-like isoform X1 [Macaca nemestrina]